MERRWRYGETSTERREREKGLGRFVHRELLQMRRPTVGGDPIVDKALGSSAIGIRRQVNLNHVLWHGSYAACMSMMDESRLGDRLEARKGGAKRKGRGADNDGSLRSVWLWPRLHIVEMRDMERGDSSGRARVVSEAEGDEIGAWALGSEAEKAERSSKAFFFSFRVCQVWGLIHGLARKLVSVQTSQ